MQTILLSRDEVARLAQELYQTSICSQVEVEENIGKMVIINVATGEYAIDPTGLDSAHHLRQQDSLARLFGIRIGYNVAASFNLNLRFSLLNQASSQLSLLNHD